MEIQQEINKANARARRNYMINPAAVEMIPIFPAYVANESKAIAARHFDSRFNYQLAFSAYCFPT